MTKRKIIMYWVILIILVTLILIFIQYYVTQRKYEPSDTQLPVYQWKSSSLYVSGETIPTSCTLSAKNCTCNLSESHDTCSFNFNIYEMNKQAHIQVQPISIQNPSIILRKSDECNSDSNQIKNCLIHFKWDKSQPGFESIQLQLVGPSGVQPLLNLQINAK